MKCISVFLLLIALLGCFFSVQAQSLPTDSHQNNVLSIAPFKLAVNRLSVSYERVYTLRRSFELEVQLFEHFALPFNFSEGLFPTARTLCNEYGCLGEMQVRGIVLNPGIRFYLSDTAPEGAFVQPFLRGFHYWGSLQASIGGLRYPASIRFSALGAGLAIGYQHRLGTRWLISWMGGTGLMGGILRQGLDEEGQGFFSRWEDHVGTTEEYLRQFPVGIGSAVPEDEANRLLRTPLLLPMFRSRLSIGYTF